jgi:modulator of FtsH protease
VHAYSTDAWESLFLAEAGASAALAGLLFVAISINLERILALRGLPGRALEAMALLVAVLVTSTFGLVPGQPRQLLGAELVGVGVVLLAILVPIEVRALRDRAGGQTRPVRLVSATMTLAAAVPFLGAGSSLILHAGGGLYWLVPAVVLALFDAIVSAWVLLIEILR